MATNLGDGQTVSSHGAYGEDGALDEEPVSALVPSTLLDANEETIVSENILVAQEELEDSEYVENYQADAALLQSVSQFNVALASTQGAFYQLAEYSTFDAAKQAMIKNYNDTVGSDWLKANSYVVRNNNGRVVAMMNGMAIVTASSGTLTFDDFPATYVTNLTTMYYYETESPSRVKIGVSGNTNYTSYNNLLLVPLPFMSGYAEGNFISTNKYERDYYQVNDNGDLVHIVTTLKDVNSSTHYESGEQTVSASYAFDKAPSFMQKGVKYYSMDGVNYYTDQLLTNKAGVYYPYYKYLSFHSKSNYTAAELNTYIANNYPSGVLANQGQAFINAQSSAGINALLELAFACHESGGGTSPIAKQKNNLFGINATDENPGNADRYDTVEQCVEYHARRWLKQGYFDARTDSRYFGSNAGNKTLGINVKYASDPYHGEKIAGWAYRIDKALGSKDYNQHSVGVTTTAAAPVYANTSAAGVLFNLTNKGGSLSGLPVVVLGESGNYYKVQSDMPIVDGVGNCYGTYSFDHVGYVSKSSVSIVNDGTLTQPTPDPDPEPTPDPGPNPTPDPDPEPTPNPEPNTPDPDPETPETVKKDSLQQLVDTASEYKKADYTEESWTTFDAALASAKAVLIDETAEQADVDAALYTLDQAIQGLKEVEEEEEDTVDKSYLEELIKIADTADKSAYTEDSWKTFSEALKKAKAVFDAEDATQKDVDDTFDALEQAILGLEEIKEEPKPSTPSSTSSNTAKKAPATSPKTSDDNLLIWGALCSILSAGCFLWITRFKKSK